MVCASLIHLALARDFAAMDSIIWKILSEIVSSFYILLFITVVLTYVGPN
jgi:hypothetical protein